MHHSLDSVDCDLLKVEKCIRSTRFSNDTGQGKWSNLAGLGAVEKRSQTKAGLGHETSTFFELSLLQTDD
jgi:hypothetical protein